MENLDRKLPSLHQIDDVVTLKFSDNKIIESCSIHGIKFTISKVFYDIVIDTEYGVEIMKDIDSVFII